MTPCASSHGTCPVPVDPRFDRVLGREHARVLVVQRVEQRVERRRLAAAGRPGDQDDAVRQLGRRL